MKKLLLLLLALFFLFPKPSYAEVIRSFETQIVADKSGIIEIKEAISYDFESEQRHGIFREIPLYSKVGNLYRIIEVEDIRVLRDGKKENFEVNRSPDEIRIKIGDKDVEITGLHTYEISYTVENGIGSNFETHDEIYWNTTGNNWPVAIEEASAKVSTSFELDPNEFRCFTGDTGSSQGNCVTEGNTVSTSDILYPGQGLTIVAVFPAKTFPPSMLSSEPPQSLAEKIFGFILKYYYLIWLFLNVVIPAYLIYWYQKNKNKTRFGKPAVNFDLPMDESGQRLAPALAGAIDTTRLERDDVTATIFDLAIRKYIKIEGKKNVRALLPDEDEQIITKLKEPDEKLLSFEKTLMERLFENGKEVKVSTLKQDFYKTYIKMEDQVFDTLVDKGYYTKNPKTQMQFLLVFALIVLFFGNLFLSAILFFLSLKLNGRTEKGDMIDHKIDGLKLFLKGMDRNYKWQAQKFYTVEQMIPFAMSLGYIDKFMEALKILKPDYNPSWYTGRGTFYTSYAAFNSAASSSFATSAPSSSSGFSGGSSGGGGGGGGGGSW